MRTQESLSRIEMHASYRKAGSWKFGTGSKMEPKPNPIDDWNWEPLM